MANDEGTGEAGATAVGDSDLLSDPTLDVLQRVLLTTDGTVVQILEAFFDDPICLGSHVQYTEPLSPADADLEPTGDETVLRRKVLLQGTRTGRNYVYANTGVLLDRLEGPLRRDLLHTSQPIGWLLRAHRMETFREMLRMGRRRAGSLAAEFGLDPDDELVYRTYRIIWRARPIMLLVEHFPTGALTASDRRRVPVTELSSERSSADGQET